VWSDMVFFRGRFRRVARRGGLRRSVMGRMRYRRVLRSKLPRRQFYRRRFFRRGGLSRRVRRVSPRQGSFKPYSKLRTAKGFYSHKGGYQNNLQNTAAVSAIADIDWTSSGGGSNFQTFTSFFSNDTINTWRNKIFWGAFENANIVVASRKMMRVNYQYIDLEVRLSLMLEREAGSADVQQFSSVPGVEAYWGPNYANDTEFNLTGASTDASNNVGWIRAIPSKDGVLRKRIYWRNKSPGTTGYMDLSAMFLNTNPLTTPSLVENDTPWPYSQDQSASSSIINQAKTCFPDAMSNSTGFYFKNQLRIPALRVVVPGYGSIPGPPSYRCQCVMTYVVRSSVSFIGKQS